MRATDRRAFKGRATMFLPAAGLVALAGCGVFATASCADSIHLDPPGGSGGGSSTASSTGTHHTTTTTTASGTGGGAPPMTCASNPDCAFPKPVCDVSAGECVECLVLSDCVGKPGTVCSLGACVCPPEEDAASPTYCASSPSAAARCVVTTDSPVDCGECNHACFGACTAGKCADKWEPLPTDGAPSARARHVAAWTGSEMFIWGGDTNSGKTATGALYNPVTRSWRQTTTANAPEARSGATAVWDDVEKVVIVWGGQGVSAALNTGGVYDPAKDTWTAIQPTGAPSPRTDHAAAWAPAMTFGASSLTHGMFVWGGLTTAGAAGDGAIYDPKNDAWTAMDAIDTTQGIGPTPRSQHTLVWDSTSKKLLIFGGYGPVGAVIRYLGDGSIFDPAQTSTSSVWTALSSLGGPTVRGRHTAVWDTNTKGMLVWGGVDTGVYPTDGAKLTTSSNSWTMLGVAPGGREAHTAVFVDAQSKMVVFGGQSDVGILDDVWSLDANLGWTQLPSGPSGRRNHTAVVSGSKMFIWGGTDGSNLATGAVLDTTP